MPRFAPGVLVFEKQPRWEPELKRLLASEPFQIRACRTPAKTSLLLKTMPGSVLLLDLTAGAAACLQLVGNATANDWPAHPILIGPSVMAQLEWAARELGACEFLEETVGSNHLAKLCRRLLMSPTRPR